MQFDMLNDLNKELLHEIGICAIGDVLSILKRVKELSHNKQQPQTLATPSSAMSRNTNLVIKRESFKAEQSVSGN